ncbi:MAG: inorganic phosphate transporter [Candidatus Nezhaarchaeota archaeon]|nr:inorganic phosphate transporter [Candidatus Nezhaarchaeota archaeon]
MEGLVLALGLAATLYMAWCLGANDAANPTECAVGAGVISLKRALVLFAVFSSLGALLQGYMVMKTLGRGIVASIDLVGAFTTALAAGLWITLCTYLGLPISTSQSITGAVIGYGLIVFGLGGVRWDIMTRVVASWLTSPLSAIAMTMLLFKLLTKLTEGKSFSGRLVKALLIASLCFSAYSFGANDVGNATGVLLTMAGGLGTTGMLMLSAWGALGIAIGGFTWGYRVIRTVAYRVTRIDPYSGAAAELSNALVVYLFTTVPHALIGYGMPISTTHTSVGSVIGAGLARRRKVSWRTVLFIVSSWLLTVPITAIMSMTLYRLATSLIPS